PPGPTLCSGLNAPHPLRLGLAHRGAFYAGPPVARSDERGVSPRPSRGLLIGRSRCPASPATKAASVGLVGRTGPNSAFRWRFFGGTWGGASGIVGGSVDGTVAPPPERYCRRARERLLLPPAADSPGPGAEGCASTDSLRSQRPRARRARRASCSGGNSCTGF